jgi:hypothetical protein
VIAGDLIRQAQESGIELRLVGGKVKAIGPREAVVRLIEPLRQHREALTHALQCDLQAALPTTPPPDPVDWHALDAAYLAHHFHCPTCIAAGCGSRYGQRCGTGAALWWAYCA